MYVYRNSDCGCVCELYNPRAPPIRSMYLPSLLFFPEYRRAPIIIVTRTLRCPIASYDRITVRNDDTL